MHLLGHAMHFIYWYNVIHSLEQYYLLLGFVAGLLCFLLLDGLCDFLKTLVFTPFVFRTDSLFLFLFISHPHFLTSHVQGVMIKAVDTKHTLTWKNTYVQLRKHITLEIYIDWVFSNKKKIKIYPFFLLEEKTWISVFHQTFHKTHSFVNQFRFC